jgi:hypothetical protein
MDRFVRGEDVPYESLRRVWENTTQVEYDWDLPIYEDFFRAVRSVNASLPRERQIRILLGDPPIDWDRVHTLADLHKEMGDRDGHAVEVIRREVLAKRRRALVIYGDEHIARGGRGIPGRLEEDGDTRVFVIHSETRADLAMLQPDAARWPRPSLVMLRGTSLGAVKPGGRSLEEQFDALLYMGPPAEMKMASLPRARCSDPRYMQMRLWRLALVPPPPTAPFNPVDRLKQYCVLSNENKEVPDSDTEVTDLVRQTIRDAAIGEVEPEHIAAESRDRLVRFAKEYGPRLLGPMGAVQSLTLLADATIDGKRIRRYRAAFAGGHKMIWTVGLTADRKILSLDAQRE